MIKGTAAIAAVPFLLFILFGMSHMSAASRVRAADTFIALLLFFVNIPHGKKYDQNQRYNSYHCCCIHDDIISLCGICHFVFVKRILLIKVRTDLT